VAKTCVASSWLNGQGSIPLVVVTSVSLPKFNDKNTDMAKYTNGFRNCVVRNVFPVLMRKEFTTQRPRVNFSHFDPKILPYLKWIPNDLTINEYWIPVVVGLAIGLLWKRNFDCEALNVEHFYAVPNYDFKESLRDLRRASAQQGKPQFFLQNSIACCIISRI
jgi:hypothetical protein